MAGDALLVTSQFVAAAAFLALAGVLLAVHFNGRVNRAFAVYLFLQGTFILLLALARLWSGEPRAGRLLGLLPYVGLPLPLILAYFIAVHRAPQGGLAARVTGIVVLLAIVLVEAMYLVDHATVISFDDGVQVAGPLFPLFQALPLAQSLTGLFLARDALRTDEAKRPAIALVALGFAVLALIEGSVVGSIFLAYGDAGFTEPFQPNLWIRLQRLMALLALALALAAIATMGALGQRAQRAGSRVTTLVVLVSLAAVTSAYIATQDLTEAGGSNTAFIVGLWRVLAVSLVTYAMVRHRFLDLDVHINWTLSRGAVLTFFVVTFVVVSKVAENFLNQRFDWAWGGVATGLLVFALKPLERLGDRIADTLAPRGREAHEFQEDEKRRLFREQAAMVWSDGVMGRKERLLLDHLRERLGIPADEAFRIEHDAAAGQASSKAPGLST